MSMMMLKQVGSLLWRRHGNRRGSVATKLEDCLLSYTFCTKAKIVGTHTSLHVRDKVGIIRLHSPGKVNVINIEVAEELTEVLSELNLDSQIVGGVLISNKPSCFIAGADIGLISEIKTAEEGTQLSKYIHGLLDRVERNKKPIVAAIMGSCLSGGLEVALACHYRLAVDGRSVFSFPEVLSGTLPGGGGTQRLPKLIGLLNAFDMTLTGKNIRTDKAKSMGLIDGMVNSLGPGENNPDERTLEYLEDLAVQIARDLATERLKVTRTPKGIFKIVQQQISANKYVKDYMFSRASKKVMKQTRGLYPAPLKILESIRAGVEKERALGYDEEAKGFGELVASKESRGLISLYHGQNECKKNKYGKSDKPVKNIAVIGAGLMGAGIADVSIRKGYQTILKDTNSENLTKGESHIQESIELSKKKKKLSRIEGEKHLSNLIPAIDYEKFSNVDMVVEAVFEDIKLKHKVLQEVECVTPDHCIYATNTSALPVTEIAKMSKRPDKVIGLHYFSPVDKMMLLEIVTTEATSKDTLRKSLEFGLKQGKVPIIVKDGPGFYTTRLIVLMLMEIYRLMIEGVSPIKIDQLTLDLGFPIGSATLADEIGFDVCLKVNGYFLDVFGDRVKSLHVGLGDEILKAGFLGRKSGKGNYIYHGNSREKTVNEELLAMLVRFREESKMPLTDENMKFRIISQFINEVGYCLQEGIISNPVEGDIGAVLGLGFPPFTGGPFHYLDSFGTDKFVAKMREVESFYGTNFTPCQLLLDYAKDPSKKFFN